MARVRAIFVASPRRLAVAPATLGLGAFLVLCGGAVLVGRVFVATPLAPELRFLGWLGSVRTPGLTTVEQGVTFLGSTLWLMIVSLVVLGWLLSRRRIADALLILGAGVGSVAITNLVKVLVDKPRPGVVPHLAATSTLSFPSGHSCSSAAVYMALALVFAHVSVPRRAAVTAAVLLAMAVAFSRLYLGVHYPTDVVAGLVLGWLWVAALWTLRHRSSARPEVRAV